MSIETIFYTLLVFLLSVLTLIVAVAISIYFFVRKRLKKIAGISMLGAINKRLLLFQAAKYLLSRRKLRQQQRTNSFQSYGS